MQRMRFRDPAGYTRTGELRGETIHAANQEFRTGDVTVLPPVEPTKIVCIGLNYEDHAEETGKDVPDRPLLFLKGPNAVAGHQDTITVPANKNRIDYEAEFGVVIGTQARNVAATDAMSVVDGYTAGLDLSNRDDQRVETNWVRGKAFDSASPIGPTIADPAEVPDDAQIRLRHNGELKQDSSIANLIFPVPALIEEITTYLTLEPGDVILTGTPSGVGPLEDGDEIEVNIEGIPTLRNTIRVP